jgi:hypothetical protein
MSEAELKALHIKRGMVKGRLTRFVTFLSTPGNKIKPELIQSRLNELRPCLREFEDIHTQIKIIDDQESDDELFQFEENFHAVVCEAESSITSISKRSTESSGPASPRTIQVDNGVPQIKLPEIQLPIFNGSFTEWVTFRDSYKSLIHENEHLSAVQRFHYLRSSLKGEARMTIEHLTPLR